jgi:hypothetical protein
MNKPGEQPLLELRWPPNWKVLSALASIGGFWVLGTWGVRAMQGAEPVVPMKLVWFCAAGPAGLGIFISACQRVAIYSDRIENHHLLFHRTLDLPSTYVSKVVKNGFYLKDDRGKKLFIHNLMVNSGKLFDQLQVYARHSNTPDLPS